jgi:UDP-N-acetylmuramate dehydrogenase
MAFTLLADRPLAPLTSIGLGGPAAHFVEVDTREQLREALAWARQNGRAVGVLGGGSNLIVGDAGFDGLVVHIALRGLELARSDDRATVTVQAGEPWETVVELAIDEQLSGVECLTGIPGSTGATPIQNVGAYGQEVSDVIDAVEVLDRQRDTIAWLTPEACEFGYRDSRFKRAPERFVVLAVRFRLSTHAPTAPRYAELVRALAQRSIAPDLRTIQQTVRALRKQKGMLIDAGFVPSAGSFFTNPIVTRAEAERLIDRALASGVITARHEVPQFAVDAERVKLAAGFLIERAGIIKGSRLGAVGISEHHALALVHHGGGSTRDLMALATKIQLQVDHVFGVTLQIEPVRWNVG